MRSAHLRKRFVALASVAALILLAACGGDDGFAESAGAAATVPDLETIPVEPFPEELPEPYLFLGDELKVEEQAAAEILYLVEPGDTLALIAEAFGVELATLQRINGIADPSLLRAGDELRIPVRPGTEGERVAATLDEEGEDFSGPPPGEEYVVEAGDTLFDIGLQFGIDWQVIAAYNRLSDFEANSLAPGTVIIIPPAAEEEEEPTEPPG